MKKLISLALTLALALSLSVSAFAATDNITGADRTSTGTVVGTATIGGAPEKVYSVYVEWGGLTFNYVGVTKVWDPSTYTFSDGGNQAVWKLSGTNSYKTRKAHWQA